MKSFGIYAVGAVVSDGTRLATVKADRLDYSGADGGPTNVVFRNTDRDIVAVAVLAPGYLVKPDDQ